MHNLQYSVGWFLTFSLVSQCVLSNMAQELKFWSRDPKFETEPTTYGSTTSPIPITSKTIDGKVLLEKVINDTNSSQDVITKLKALRKIGLSLDGLMEDIDKMEGDIKTMDLQNKIEGQVRRMREQKSQHSSIDTKKKREQKKSNNIHPKKGSTHQPIKKKTNFEVENNNNEGENSFSFENYNAGGQKPKEEDIQEPLKQSNINIKKQRSKKHRSKNQIHAMNKKIVTKHEVSKRVSEHSRPRTKKQSKRIRQKSYKHTSEKKRIAMKEKLRREKISELKKKILLQGQGQSGWPKVKLNHWMFSSKERVTRMDQLLLRQDNEKKPGNGEKDGKDEPAEKLSPFTIKRQLNDICEGQFPGSNITISTLGRTAEYNDLVLLKVAEKRKESFFRTFDDKYVEDAPQKKIVFIVHGLSTMGIHAVPCLSVVEKWIRLLSFYFNHLDKFDIYVMPMANPDGVAYSSTFSLWNKNVSPQSACPGVCLDRNFDVAWNVSRSVSSCSQQYPGPAPFSEPESRAVRDVLHRYNQRIIAFLHVHAGTHSPMSSYKGDAVLYPRGYTDTQSDDDRYIDLKGELDEVMKNASFKMYTVAMDTLASWYGKIAGSSVDFASTVYGIPYAMEFVMQPLINDPYLENEDEQEQNQALEEVWKRVIDTIFNNIHKTEKIPTQQEEEENKYRRIMPILEGNSKVI